MLIAALSVSYAVAIGGSFLGFEAPMARPVLYFDGEMPASTIQRRLALIIRGFGVQPLDPAFFRLLSADVTDGGLPDLGTPEGQAEIDAAVGDAELIIIDNLSALLRRGKENDGESWLPVQSWALALGPVHSPCWEGRLVTWHLPPRGRARHRDRVASAGGLSGRSRRSVRDPL